MSTSLDTSAEEKLTVAAVHDRCTNMFSSVEITYGLATGVCNYDFVFVKEVRKFPQLSTHEFYNVTPQVVFFDYDSCEKSCARDCVLHGTAAPAGYCRHCDRPLSIVPHKIHFNVGSFGTAKPYEQNALLMKRVCPGSKFCPGSGQNPSIQTHPSCESAPKNSYSLRDDRHRSHVSKNMWIHELLIDVMVHFSKHPDVVAEYMKVFRRAVLLRHVNLFHQERFSQERDALQVNASDIDEMTSSLFARPDGLARDAEDTGFNGDLNDTPSINNKRKKFDTQKKNSRSGAPPTRR
jgi:hypothetical protein